MSTPCASRRPDRGSSPAWVVWDVAGNLPLGLTSHEGSMVIVGLKGLRLANADSRAASSTPV